MAFKSEFAVWRDEIEPPPRLTIPERLKAWIERPAPPVPQPEMYQWHDVSSLVPIDGENL